MATLSLLRAAGAARLTKVAGPALLRHTPSTSILAKKTFSVTQVREARIYGPEEGLPSDTNHWKLERILSAVLYPVIPAAVIFPNPVLDYALAATVVLHTHWGFEAVVTDYVHGETLYPIAKYGVLAASILAFGGLAYLNMHDVGFGQSIRDIFMKL